MALLLAATTLASLGAISSAGVAHAQKNLPPAAAQAIDTSVSAAIDGARANVKARPGSVYEAQVFGQEVDNAFVAGTVARGKLDGSALINEANGYFDAAMKAVPDQAVRLLSVKAVMLEHAGRMDDARAVAKQAEALYASQQSAQAAKTAPDAPKDSGGAAAGSSAGNGATTTRAATSVLVLLTNKCAKDVSLGKGATATTAAASNATFAAGKAESSELTIGDSVWLFDKSGKAIAHAHVDAHTKKVDVAKSCKSIAAH